MGMFLALPLVASEYRLVLKDWTGRGFAPDLIRYRLPGLDNDAATGVPAVVDSDGEPVPVQLVPADDGGMDLAFVASIPPDGTHVYRLRPNPGRAMPPSPIRVVRRRRSLELVSDRLAVRVPPPAERHFRRPVAAKTLPAPILGFRSGANAWLGGGQMLSDRRVAAYSMRIVASGPVFAAVRYEMVFEGGGFYRADIRVTLHAPLVHVREEYDAGELDGSDYWALDLTGGWEPDLMEVATTMGNSGVDNGQTVPLAELGATPDPISARWMIVPDSAWHTPRSQFGLLRSEDHIPIEDQNREGRVVRVWDTVRENAPMAGFVPLHKGDWRRSTGIEIHTPDSRRVSLHLPISVRHARSATETTQETGVHSFHEHDPALPVTYGRRVWGLVLAPPALRTLAEFERAAGPFYQARLFYGIVGLDRYKDYTLEWPDTGTKYPRVFLQPDEVERFRQTLDLSPAGERLRQLWYVLSGDEAVARRRRDALLRDLAYLANFMLISPTIGHHKMATAYLHAAAAEDVLAWPGLPPEDRLEIRSRLALVTYLMQEADVMSYGNGTHTGNSNMGVARAMPMCTFMALLPDHPMFSRWRTHMERYTAYKLGSLMATGGAWNEFGGSYHVHSMARINHAVMGLKSSGAGSLDLLYRYLVPDWEYYMNLLTPFDSRWQARMIPGLANSPPSFTAHLFETAAVFAERDPELAAHLRWSWRENGAAGADGDLAGTLNGLMERPWVQPDEPELASRFYPGLGVVFRAHQGPDETYMLFRSGFNWGHWYIDQGHFVLMSRGATLVPFQPYQYWHREWSADESFDRYNQLRFGHVLNDNPSGWPDSNILDYAFGRSVEYAWSSSAFPEHHLKAMKLDDQPGQIHAPFTWNRQVMFLKGSNATAPNYFVFRDSFDGPGMLANWWFINLLGRKSDIRTEGNRIAVDTEWPVALDLVFAGGALPPVDWFEENLPLVSWGGPFWREANKDKPISPNWVQRDGSPMVHPPARNDGSWEQHVFLRIPGKPGQEYFWLAYPRASGEALPQVLQAAPGVLVITTGESKDYVFLSAGHIAYEDDEVAFEGSAGAVRIRNGKVELSLSGGQGRVVYRGRSIEGHAPIEEIIPLADLTEGVTRMAPRASGIDGRPVLVDHARLAPGVSRATNGTVTEYRFEADTFAPIRFERDGVSILARRGTVRISPNGVRFIVEDGNYAELSAGEAAIRGLGPFDLLFTDDAVAGIVDGRARTLVCTRPKHLIRPMYRMDGVHWFAGHATAGPPATGDPIQDNLRGEPAGVLPARILANRPSMAIAFGVDAGQRQVAIQEWEWPELPTPPPRAAIGITP